VIYSVSSQNVELYRISIIWEKKKNLKNGSKTLSKKSKKIVSDYRNRIISNFLIEQQSFHVSMINYYILAFSAILNMNCSFKSTKLFKFT